MSKLPEIRDIGFNAYDIEETLQELQGMISLYLAELRKARIENLFNERNARIESESLAEICRTKRELSAKRFECSDARVVAGINDERDTGQTNANHAAMPKNSNRGNLAWRNRRQ